MTRPDETGSNRAHDARTQAVAQMGATRASPDGYPAGAEHRRPNGSAGADGSGRPYRTDIDRPRTARRHRPNGTDLDRPRPDRPTLPVVIFRLIGHPGDLNYGMALAGSVVLGGTTALVMLLVERLRVPSVGTF